MYIDLQAHNKTLSHATKSYPICIFHFMPYHIEYYTLITSRSFNGFAFLYIPKLIVGQIGVGVYSY